MYKITSTFSGLKEVIVMIITPHEFEQVELFCGSVMGYAMGNATHHHCFMTSSFPKTAYDPSYSP